MSWFICLSSHVVYIFSVKKRSEKLKQKKIHSSEKFIDHLDYKCLLMLISPEGMVHLLHCFSLYSTLSFLLITFLFVLSQRKSHNKYAEKILKLKNLMSDIILKSQRLTRTWKPGAIKVHKRQITGDPNEHKRLSLDPKLNQIVRGCRFYFKLLPHYTHKSQLQRFWPLGNYFENSY